jgi:preprotein translocase subunit SecE
MYAFVQELFHTGIYKRTQGRVTRQVTFAAIALAIVAGLWRLNLILMSYSVGVAYAVPGVLLLLGLWAGYRIVNVPEFADFLIAVEAEMNKVSWPTRSELYRSCVVVLVTLLLLSTVLFAFDVFWGLFFKWIGVL